MRSLRILAPPAGLSCRSRALAYPQARQPSRGGYDSAPQIYRSLLQNIVSFMGLSCKRACGLCERPTAVQWAEACLIAVSLPCVAVCCSVCCSVLQCAVVCCSVLQCAAVCRSALQWASTSSIAVSLPRVAVCCGVLQCVAVCCSVLQCASTSLIAANLPCPRRKWRGFD